MRLRDVSAGVGAALAGYALTFRPWHVRGGATDEEIGRAMPLALAAVTAGLATLRARDTAPVAATAG
jgi:hypothetical protein